MSIISSSYSRLIDQQKMHDSDVLLESASPKAKQILTGGNYQKVSSDNCSDNYLEPKAARVLGAGSNQLEARKIRDVFKRVSYEIRNNNLSKREFVDFMQRNSGIIEKMGTTAIKTGTSSIKCRRLQSLLAMVKDSRMEDYDLITLEMFKNIA
jgi:hypothetical protein